jgi:hypothetical protein
MKMPQLPALSVLLCGLVLASCARTLDEISNDDPYGGAQVMAGESSIVRLAPEWDAQRLLTTRQVSDGVLVEEIVLANATTAPRENKIRVQTRWRGAGTFYGVAREMPSPFTMQAIEERLAAEFMEAAPEVKPIQRRNRNGPYLYVQTHMADAGTCIFAWQMTDAVPELRTEAHAFALDLRFCRPGDDPAEIIALFDSIELAPRL